MPSQLGADTWVLSLKFSPLFDPLHPFFVDVGAFHGEHLSNTHLLEQHGYSGICIDANPNVASFASRPNSKLVTALMDSEDGLQKEFIFSASPELNGIRDYLAGYHKQGVLNSIRKADSMTTRSLASILDEHHAPRYIHYLTLDIEGAEYEVLKTFPFDRYTFGALTIEHNGVEPKRSQIRTLLEQHGYIYHKEVKWDDWYIYHHQGV